MLPTSSDKKVLLRVAAPFVLSLALWGTLAPCSQAALTAQQKQGIHVTANQFYKAVLKRQGKAACSSSLWAPGDWPQSGSGSIADLFPLPCVQDINAGMPGLVPPVLKKKTTQILSEIYSNQMAAPLQNKGASSVAVSGIALVGDGARECGIRLGVTLQPNSSLVFPSNSKTGWSIVDAGASRVCRFPHSATA